MRTVLSFKKFLTLFLPHIIYLNLSLPHVYSESRLLIKAIVPYFKFSSFSLKSTLALNNVHYMCANMKNLVSGVYITKVAISSCLSRIKL